MKTRLLLMSPMMLSLVACSSQTSDSPPWMTALAGVFCIVIAVVLFMAFLRGKLEIKGPGGSRFATEEDGCLVGLMLLFPLGMGILLISSALGNKTSIAITNGLDTYSHWYETMENGFKVIGFLIFEVILLVVLIKEAINFFSDEGDQKDSFGFLLFWGVLNGAYWTWIFWTHKFQEAFIQPFTSIYHLFFK
jgi:hypothetical protein